MTDFLLLAFTFLIAGVIAVPIATRLGLGSVLGYLIAGIAISPLLGLLGVDVVSIQHFAEFGVVMMLFLVGLELEPKLLWEMRARLLGLGGLQVAGTTAAITGIAMAFGQPWQFALAIGLILALSSTAIVLQTLNEKGLMKSDGGQSGFSVLLFQDIAVIPMLAFIPLLAVPDLMAQFAADASHAAADAGHYGDAGHGDDAHHDDGDHGSSLSLVAHLPGWQAALVTLGAVAFVVFAGGFLTRPLFRFIARSQMRELFTAAALMMVIGIALLMSLVGLSPALGTFIAGVVLANSEYRHELESDIDPFRGLLLGLFFMTVGASINFALLSAEWQMIIGAVLGLILLKAAVLYILGKIFGLKGSNLWLLTLGLAQAGEFGFVLLSFTASAEVLPAAITDRLSLVVAISMLLTPLLFIIHERLISPKFSADQAAESDEIDEDNKIIIAGHGRVGGLISRMLSAAGFKATVVDYSAAQLDLLRMFGIKVYYGDATRPDLLAAAGIAEARLFIIAIDDQEKITNLVRYVKRHHPDVHIMARAMNRHHVYELYEAGCRDIIRSYYDSSIRMGRSAFEALGIGHDHAVAMAQAFDESDRASMITLAEFYDSSIPATQNEAYINAVKEISGPREEELRAKMDAIRAACEGVDGEGGGEDKETSG
ncbi:MAG: cation:proton antiporter [Maricaulis sp.]|uniref:cation:proton antiporter domain-containing protein n=1 Tax=Maricaulis sp. TaxID=1486257 RepID=UPI001B1ACBF6|nr:cation:proton antiporter [Maricaulis sp.]MBO6846775.1 cation:proton antiporter [Maricaulis sp.]MBO6877864.1 cation:proton antiporter [Maricaulis sp.]